MEAFTQAIRDAIDALIGDSKESIAFDAFCDVDACKDELGQAVIDRSRHRAPTSGGSTTTSAPVGCSSSV